MSRRSTIVIADVGVIFVDSITQIVDADAGKIVISGSHGGTSAASFAAEVPARLYVFNDAGIGKENAGIAGLKLLEQKGMASLAIAHTSAKIGSAEDAYQSGVVSAVNEPAAMLGFKIGQKLKSQLAELLLNDK